MIKYLIMITSTILIVFIIKTDGNSLKLKITSYILSTLIAMILIYNILQNI